MFSTQTMIPAKIVLAITAMFAILFGVAIQLRSATPDAVQSIPVPKSAPEPAKLFDAVWQESVSVAALQKSDRMRVVSTEPQPVMTERVVANLRDDPVIVPPVVERPVLDKPRAEKRRRRKQYTSAAEPEVCVRHGMHRVFRPNGKSWRCVRPTAAS